MKNFLAKLVIFIVFLTAESLLCADDQSYEIGLPAQRIELQNVRYTLDSVDIPFDPKLFENFSKWKHAKSVVYLWADEVRNKRLVINFNLTLTHAMPLYIEYPWNMPSRDARLFIRDESGQITTAELFRAQAPIWTSYLPRGTYSFLAVLEPSPYADAKTGINVMNAYYMTGFRSIQSSFRILIYGIGLAFIFFNLAMYILHRAPYFIYYVGYSLSILYLLGIGSSHVYYPHASLWNVALWLNGLFAALMSSSVLRLRKFHPRLLQLSLLFVGLASVFFTLAYALSMPALIFGGYLVGLVVYFICVYAAIRRMLSGYVPAIFFATGWAVLFLGYILNMVGLYVLNFHVLNWSAYIAYALESMLFAVALAYRTRDTEVRAVQDKIHALSQLEKVVYPHQMELIKSGAELETTMPTHSGQACVLSFDIVGSSKIKHIKAKAFLRNIFARCNDIMSEGYDGRHLKANAYRIKEMGDGFLCSVGYPFQSHSENPANDAVDLARRFAQVLAEESKSLHSDTPIVCGIGIALDTITGFYPNSGTKEYDLFGPAITLATRYESMRKTLFEKESERSLIIIQEVVYRSLDPSHREGFQSIRLKERGIVVRDDPAAELLYFKVLLADGHEALAAV